VPNDGHARHENTLHVYMFESEKPQSE